MRAADHRPSPSNHSPPKAARAGGSVAGATKSGDDDRSPLDRLLTDDALWEEARSGDLGQAPGQGSAGLSPSEAPLGRRAVRSARRDTKAAQQGKAGARFAETGERRRDLDALFAEDATEEGDPDTARAQDLDAILAALEDDSRIESVPSSADPKKAHATDEVAPPAEPSDWCEVDVSETERNASDGGGALPATIAAGRAAAHAASQASRTEPGARQVDAEERSTGNEASEQLRAEWRGVDGGASGPAVSRASTDPPVPVPVPTAPPPARVRPAPARAPSAQGESPQRRRSDPLDDVLDLGPKRRKRKRANLWLVRAVWAVLIAALFYIAFQPYSFEVGGEFVVQPMDRAEVRARTDGEIVEIRVAEGDWVEQGDALAVLSNWDELREIALLEAEVAKLEADLATLLAGATPEEIAAAEQRVQTAQVQVEIAYSNLSRQQQLVEREVAPANSLQEHADEVRLAEAGLEEAEAALLVIRSEARESEVAAAQAAINRAGENLAFSRQQLEHTMIRATVDGQIVSSLSDVPVGAFLPEGGLFVELQDNRTVIVEIEVPETEIEEVEIGAEAELRPWSTPDQSIYGTVRTIAPTAVERDFGRVVRVLVEVPNTGGRLAANMTGYAKIDAEDRPVWQAFTRVFVRFFEVEIWSWLP